MESCHSIRNWFGRNRVIPLVLITALFLLGTSFAQNGAIRGTVSSKTTGEPLPGANVILVGTSLGAATDADGQFLMTGVPQGNYQIRVVYIGYRDVEKTVTVPAGQTVTVNFAMAETNLPGQEVVVSASRKSEKITEAPATIDIIDARTIEDYPSPNVGELLARQKGVDYVRSGVVGVGINVRGFNSAFNPKNLQMNDGRLSTLIATGLPLGPLSTVVKEDIDRVEVILGPSAALYGPNAHNGLVNTITKDPRQYPGTTVVLDGGNQSSVAGRFRHARVVSPKFAYKITGAYSRAIEFNFVDSVYIAGKGFNELDLDRNVNSARGELGLYFTPKKGNDFIVSAGGSNSNYLAPTNAGRNQIKDWRIFYLQGRYSSKHLFAELYHTWSRTDSTYAINQRTQNYWSFKAAGFSESEAKKRSFREFWFAPFGISLNRTAIFIDDSRRWNAEVQYNNTFGGFHVIAGAQWQEDIANSKHTYLLDNNGPIKLDQEGFYAQIEKPLGKSGLKAVFAAREDHHELYGSNFIPKAALVYAGKTGTWRFTYGKGIAAPTILNLSANIFGGLLLGNGEGFTVKDAAGNISKVPAVDVETVQNLELGYKGVVHKKLYVDANAYFNFSKNFLSPLINIAPPGGTVIKRGNKPMSEVIPGTPASGSPFVLTYLNFGKVNTYGVDVGLNYFVNKYVNVSANYSYFNFHQDKNDPKNDGNRDGKVDVNDLPINTPENKASLAINYHSTGLFGNLFFRWVQSYDFFSGINVRAKSNPNLIYNGDPVLENHRVGRDFNTGPLGDFLNVDAGIGYRFKNGISIAAQMTNVFDTTVREFVAAPSIGRLFTTELKYSF